MATKREDFTQVAFDVAQRATGETAAPAPSKKRGSERKGSCDEIWSFVGAKQKNVKTITRTATATASRVQLTTDEWPAYPDAIEPHSS